MQANSKIKLVATDLDGTLLRQDKSISDTDLNSLNRLKEAGIIRVAATGRSLYKVKEVLPHDLPLDFVVFSSGAGVYDWKNEDLLHREYFTQETSQEIVRHLLEGNYNFFVYQPIPNNNLFQYHQGAERCAEFENYMERHSGDFTALEGNQYKGNAGQIMAVIPNETALFEALKAEIESACEGIRVIRTTSPINDDYIWLEVFPDTVSKGHGIRWLCDYLSIDYAATLGIGNDYNDLDMFEFVAYPYVLSNGINELQERYHSVGASNDESGFSSVIRTLI